MSSMDTKRLSRLFAGLRAGVAPLAVLALTASPALADDAASGTASATQDHFSDVQWQPGDWERARQRQMAVRPGPMAYAVSRWQQLQNQPNPSFAEVSGFIAQYPGLPNQESLQEKAEGRLASEYVDAARLVSFFDSHPPLTAQGQAQYALALRSLGRPQAIDAARRAWRAGAMSPTAEASLSAMFGGAFTTADHLARVDELLWQNEGEAAARQMRYITGPERGLMMARLAAAQGSDPSALGLQVPASAAGDPGWIYNRARQLRNSGQQAAARSFIVNSPALNGIPTDPLQFVREMRYQAGFAVESGDIGTAVRIAQRADSAFPAGTDVSKLSGPIRDEYEKLFYTVGEAAMQRGDNGSAARMFAIYGASQMTAPARTKGFYFAGLAAQKAGMGDFSRAEFEKAAAYPDQFYGQMALEKLGRPLAVPAGRLATPSAEARAEFNRRPLVQASREVGRAGDWRTGVAFFKELGRQAETAEEYALIAELARETGRRDLAVIAGREASTKQVYAFSPYAFPRVDVPTGAGDWTMVHAISRQESQFATDAVSHAGARGLMQLMPGTAQEQAGKMYLSYNSGSLISDPQYNIRLGSGYFARMMDVFGGSYPLAIAAYNAGPGNVGKWLRANGDPRRGEIGWVEWIEAIPFSETRRYVARVLENAAYYDALYPDAGNNSGAYPLSYYMRKQPGS
jgi:soluble lytic murein transglycosylase